MTHLESSQSQIRDDDIQRKLKKPTLIENGLEEVFSPTNLQRAWKRVKRNKGAPGIDRMSIESFPAYIKKYWQSKLLPSLYNGSYRPSPVRRVIIEKDDGGERLLGIPNVFDRWIMQAIAQVISPVYEPDFSEYSYGFRENRSGQMAVKHVQECIKLGRKIAVDVDLSKFFDRVNHDYLMTKLGLRVKDKALMHLIGCYLRAGIIDAKGQYFESDIGVPQGSPLSPLLSNIVLDELDKELERRGHQFARYADDFIILVQSLRAGKRVLDSVTKFVNQQLKLKVNEHKSQVVPIKQSKFLGFTFNGKWLKWHPKTINKFKRRVCELTGRSWGVSMQYRLKELNKYLGGWINYFGIANQFQLCVDLDCWIRRRIRQCFWKSWRKVRTKVTNLLKLGVYKPLAVACGTSGKSYWHSSKTEGINKGITDQFLRDLGLISLKQKWIAVHYPH